MPARNFLTLLASTTVPRARVSESLWRGKSAIKRAAIIPFSRCDGSPSARVAMDEANLRVALSRGNCANSAASCHGSRSNRANAESTLSGVSFRSSQTRANRKTLNSDPTTETGPVIFTAKCVASIERAQFRAFVEGNLYNFAQVSRNRLFHSATRYFGKARHLPLTRPGFDATLIGVTALAAWHAAVQSRIFQLCDHSSRTRA